MRNTIHTKALNRVCCVVHSIVIIGCLILCSFETQAQNKEQFRNYLFHRWWISPSFRVSTGLGVHYEPEDDQWNRFEFRQSIFYIAHPQIVPFVSYRILKSHDNIDLNQNEYRPIQGIQLVFPWINRIRIIHRFMIEERFFKSITYGETDFSGRFRYRVDAKIPLNRRYVITKALYIRPLFEMYLSFSEGDLNPFVSQMKAVIAPGYKMSRVLNAELRYELLMKKSIPSDSGRDLFGQFRFQLTKTLFYKTK